MNSEEDNSVLTHSPQLRNNYLKMTPATGPVSRPNSKPCEGRRNLTTNFTYLILTTRMF